MNPEFSLLRHDVKLAEARLKEVEGELARRIRACDHEWLEPKYDPIVQGGYQHPGDPPGTMGVDHIPSYWVPRTESPRWTRECRKCGWTNTTTQSDEKVTRSPRF